MTAPAASRTWPTEPGAPVIPSECERLDRVDHADGGLLGLERGERPTRPRSPPAPGPPARRPPEPLRTEPNLRRRLLARTRRGPLPPAPREVAERHAGERGLADPGRAAEQDERAGDQPAAEHPVELGDARQQAVDLRRLDLAQRHRPGSRCPGALGATSPAPAASGALGLDQGVPLAAARAAARPCKRGVPAFLTDEMGISRHGWPIVGGFSPETGWCCSQVPETRHPARRHRAPHAPSTVGFVGYNARNPTTATVGVRGPVRDLRTRTRGLRALVLVPPIDRGLGPG